MGADAQQLRSFIRDPTAGADMHLVTTIVGISVIIETGMTIHIMGHLVVTDNTIMVGLTILGHRLRNITGGVIILDLVQE
jgi:hypothetical protein